MKKMGLLVVAVFVLAFTIGMSAKAASFKEDSRVLSEKQYRTMEEEYINEVRMILLEKGCKNAGIALTYVEDAIGNREYTVTIHHTRLEKMNNQELALLKSRMQESAEEILLTGVSMKQL